MLSPPGPSYPGWKKGAIFQRGANGRSRELSTSFVERQNLTIRDGVPPLHAPGECLQQEVREPEGGAGAPLSRTPTSWGFIVAVRVTPIMAAGSRIWRGSLMIFSRSETTRPLAVGEKAIPAPYQATTQQVLLVNNLVVHQLLEVLFAQGQQSASAQPATQAQTLPGAPPPIAAVE
jgi:hypothetical protein